jgi:hypothetical protein
MSNLGFIAPMFVASTIFFALACRPTLPVSQKQTALHADHQFYPLVAYASKVMLIVTVIFLQEWSKLQEYQKRPFLIQSLA